MENKTSQTFGEAIEKAVNWWVSKSFLEEPNQDNGDVFMSAFATVVAKKVKHTVTPEKIEIFKKALEASIIEEKRQYPRRVHIGVDYDPNNVLYPAMKLSGLSTLLLPIKTAMIINEENEVSVSHGYGGDWVTL